MDCIVHGVAKSQTRLSNFHFTFTREGVKVAQSCLTLRNPMDCSLPGFSVHGIFQARILALLQRNFLTQGSNPCPVQWKRGVLTTGPPGRPQ